jgi:hypothetical protein
VTQLLGESNPIRQSLSSPLLPLTAFRRRGISHEQSYLDGYRQRLFGKCPKIAELADKTIFKSMPTKTSGKCQWLEITEWRKCETMEAPFEINPRNMF